jgi:thiol-disulfide isomerase/thioredoxin
MSKTGLFIVGGIVIVVAVMLGTSLTGNKETEVQVQNQPVPVTEAQVINNESVSWYTDYSDGVVAEAAVSGKRAIIFFHAGWCPTCLAASRDFEAHRDQIPSDVVIVKADYDTETDLKKKYGVVMQDTFVQVDAEGNVLATWNSGGEGIKTLLANVQ